MTQEDNIIVPRWFLENVENTLRIQNNINIDLNKKTGETCQDRNVRESLNGLRKLLKGEELTGMERLEKLQSPLPSNLDEAAEEYGRKEYSHAIHFWDEGLSKNKPEVMKEDFVDAFKAGAEWMAGQGVSLSHLISWYIQSVDAHEPVWTEEHLEELVKDYILIPKN